ncbi:MAG TPA: chorismate mutase [Dehalococcoidia bacterium]|jgi:chorismate mutase|nr:chorismate mutase [Dehalococcoidia bacterium]MDP6273706.1 chorismate mutase [Dehalococcoidia bacterium]MDP7160732.1 chorismate mutase [Dehalococcoidia bacterium]MDP7212280.1 chorismate mutase [Dehalococcoidia bacterium]MDP7515450.1 chorismate mutase [Dehalococcoidia bacterium]
MTVRGVRGATTVTEDTREAILDATTELITEVMAANGIDEDDLASVQFTTTDDLVSEFPAVAARMLGWVHVPLMNSHEMNVPHGFPRCIRVLMMWNTETAPQDIKHIYLRDAVNLRAKQSKLT